MQLMMWLQKQRLPHKLLQVKQHRTKTPGPQQETTHYSETTYDIIQFLQLSSTYFMARHYDSTYQQFNSSDPPLFNNHPDQFNPALNNSKQVASSFRITFFCPILTLKERMPKTLSPSTSGISWEIVQSYVSVPLWSKPIKQMARGSGQAILATSLLLFSTTLVLV